MKARLKEGGIATFWLPINQLKIDEAKAILRAFHNVFSNASVWGSADSNWIMMGINGSGRKGRKRKFGIYGAMRIPAPICGGSASRFRNNLARFS